jgi:hypothetical protein
MASYKVKSFERFARKNGLADSELEAAANRVLAGNADANLGGGLYKVRVAKAGRGKSGGFRTLITHRSSEHCFFVFGFEKSSKSNIDSREEKALKQLGKSLGELSELEIKKAIAAGEFVKVEENENEGEN